MTTKKLFCCSLTAIALLMLLTTCKENEKPIPVLPVAAFVISQADSLANLKVSFENKSENAISFIWDFGDGESSTQKSPAHIYKTGGVYTVRLTAIGKENSDMVTQTVRVADVPIADFRYVSCDSLDTAAVAPCEVVFRNLSINADRYFWDFGDGGTSNQTNPVYAYQEGGTYTIRLSAFKSGRVHRTERTIVVRNAPPKPLSAFEIVGGDCVAPCELSFINTSTNASKFFWDFGDGTSSELKEPVKRYAKGGIYRIALRATGKGGIDLSSRSVNIIFRPTAAFEYSGGDCKAPCVVRFINLSENAEDYLWDFGDGGYSTLKEPEYRYAKAGSYTVTLTVKAAGVSASTTQRVRINE